MTGYRLTNERYRKAMDEETGGKFSQALLEGNVKLFRDEGGCPWIVVWWDNEDGTKHEEKTFWLPYQIETVDPKAYNELDWNFWPPAIPPEKVVMNIFLVGPDEVTKKSSPWAYFENGEWYEWNVTIDGKVRTKKMSLSPGDKVEYIFEPKLNPYVPPSKQEGT